MKLYMKQKVFSLRGDFDIYDENQVPVYSVQGKLMSFGRQLRLYDSATGEELAHIKQQVMTLLPKMHVFYQNERIATISKKLTFFKQQYDIDTLGWSVEGDFFAHDYTVFDAQGRTVADINKKYLSWSDSFEVNIVQDEIDPAMVIAIVLAIDCAMDASQNS
ncbi:hypothetical protein GIY11_09700 [Aerococcaceae bacterium DSM 109653]|uniref:LURP-one-related family protein n=1 Tax=Fundicoccus ignavus TaxID=2664442 RepID=A0A6I2G9S3_9LACT|nr:LURP-one-related family protein [Fundicoccus ignavus]MRI82280.1 hypothetical protein [Fundicoccus ignavus]MRI84537.1 hypothetical protein [Fundicoccus ignavus]